eukprot:TRINITY_DN2239_c2_g1_i1.p1 TRINITY_DN2239_c2_g1~~TRINITY_DN2239_c2_g1_i1.p1  ORF type:complete len:840 (-),score=209.01 TRINITY_DN2239_c2_g1_i1:120-2486(-)
MSERTIKEWLRQFAYDGDADWLCCQWLKWTADASAEESSARQSKAMTWLLERGLDDSTDARTVCKALEQLLAAEPALLRLAEAALSAYSDEDIEDIALDNPMVRDFVSQLRTLFAAHANGKAGDGAPEQARGAGGAAAGGGAAAAASADGDRGECVYTRPLLLAARQRLLASASSAAASPALEPEVRWRTVPVSPRSQPAPAGAAAAAGNRGGAGAGAGAGTAAASRRQGASSSAAATSRDWREARSGGGGGAGGERLTLAAPSSTSWAAQARRSRAATASRASAGDSGGADDGAEEDARLLREFRGTLNKLTVDKFEQLSDHVVMLISASSRPNSGVPMLMQLVFEKATTQHHFIPMYVDLCVKVHRWFMSSGKASAPESQSNFKRILLNQCQCSFERYLDPPEGLEGLVGEELYEAQVKYKTRMLGNIRLVGALISRGMLVSKIAIAVAEALVREDPEVRDERLETLAVFLEAVGPALDDASWTHHASLSRIFSEVALLAVRADIPCRIRCLLRDVLDLRRSGWRDGRRRAQTSEAPATLAEVAAAAQADAGAAPQLRRNFVGSGPSGSSSGYPSAQRSSPKFAPKAAPPMSPKGPFAAASPKASPKASSTKAFSSPGGGAVPSSPLTGAARTPPLSPEDGRRRLGEFHKELAIVFRQVGSGALVAAAAAERLNAFRPLPAGAAEDEAPDVLARLVDEPEEARRRLLPLLTALADGGVLPGRDLWGRAVESFASDAMADPDDLDPPNLVDILLGELLPALGLRPATLQLPACCRRGAAEPAGGRRR